ncbi:MAG: hypothetical protein ACI31R_02750 [Bacilli bacterium]
MNNITKIKQSSKYKKDINNIYNEINKHIPYLKNWQLNQSVIFEENKKILCKAITNDKKEKIGNKISIYFTEDSLCLYELINSKNSLSFIKSYTEDEKIIKEIINISLSKNLLSRSCLYKENEKELSYKEIYNIKEDTTKIETNIPILELESFEEIEEILEEIKQIFKNEKKVKHL